jgi:hypothetical protein
MLRVLALAALSSACITTRSINLPPYELLAEQPLSTSWVLSEVTVRAPTNPELAHHRFGEVQHGLERHLRDVLEADPALGVHEGPAQWAVEVEVQLNEAESANPYIAATVGASVAAPSIGAVVGAVIGGPIASIVGAGVGGAVALVGNTFTPAATYAGQLQATVVVRRASDGVEVARRSAHAEWSTDLNRWGIAEKLADAQGEALIPLERELARSLREVFTSLEPVAMR